MIGSKMHSSCDWRPQRIQLRHPRSPAIIDTEQLLRDWRSHENLGSRRTGGIDSLRSRFRAEIESKSSDGTCTARAAFRGRRDPRVYFYKTRNCRTAASGLQCSL